MKPEAAGRKVVILSQARLGVDSRVLKQARSLQDRGWDVVAVAPDKSSKDVDIGGARVVVADLPRSLHAQRSVHHRSIVRSPLAYPTRAKGNYLVAWHRAQLADLRYRVDAARARQSPTAPVRIPVLRALALHQKVRLRWSEYRLTLVNELIKRRQNGIGVPERIGARFWSTTLGNRSWRRLWPEAHTDEAVYGPIIDAEAPDIIQANDFRMLAVGARAKLRARARGVDVKLVWDVREYLQGMSPWSPHPRWKPAHVALEAEFAPWADAVMTVSEPLGDLMVRDFGLSEAPAVVMNAPVITDPPISCPTDVRTECGLAPDVPLVVYSGGAAPQRGLDLMIEALPQLPGVHTALVVLQPGATTLPPYVEGLVARARELGMADNLHVLPYVPSEQVVAFLSTASVGVFPGLPYVNHTISLITKFLEYSHAGLPIVVSELKHMADTVRETGQGEAFPCEDVAGYVSAITKVLDNRASYLDAYRDEDRMRSWAWEQQADVQHRLFLDVAER